MNLPKLPSKFSSGETLTAAKLNALVDWMRDVARLLPSLQVSAGTGLTYARENTGTTLSLAQGYVQGGVVVEEAADAAAESSFPRRLFHWTSSAGADDEGNPTWTVSVSDGLALLRPYQASAPAPSVAGVVLSAFSGEVDASVAKTELSFEPERFASELSFLRSAALEDADSETAPASVTELISLNVPGYALTAGATANVLTGLAESSARRSVNISIAETPKALSVATSASFKPATLQLSANPLNQAPWTHVLVVHETALQSKVKLNTELVALPAHETTATLDLPAVSAGSSVSVPLSYTLTPTGTASSTEVSVTIPIAGEKKLTTELASITGWLTGGTVRSRKIEDQTELTRLDFSDAQIGTAKLAGEDELSRIAPVTKDFQLAAQESTLHWVKGETFSLSPADAGTLILLVCVMSGGQPSFFWEKKKLPAADDAGTELSLAQDDPQNLKLRCEAAVAAGENGATIFGVVGGLEETYSFSADWRVSVPMAVVFESGEGAGAYVEPLTWGCVEIRPRLRVTLNGGAECEIAGAPAAAQLSDAQVAALAAAPASAYNLEARDFSF